MPAKSHERYARPLIDMSCLSIADTAYVCGLFDGEGTVGVYETKNKTKNGGRRSAWHYEVQIANTDIRIMKWLLDKIGGRMALKSKGKEHWSQGYVWRLTGENAVKFFIAIRPYSIIKKEQIDVALEFRTLCKARGNLQTEYELAKKREMAGEIKLLKRVNYAI